MNDRNGAANTFGKLYMFLPPRAPEETNCDTKSIY